MVLMARTPPYMSSHPHPFEEEMPLSSNWSKRRFACGRGCRGTRSRTWRCCLDQPKRWGWWRRLLRCSCQDSSWAQAARSSHSAGWQWRAGCCQVGQRRCWAPQSWATPRRHWRPSDIAGWPHCSSPSWCRRT